MRYLLLVILLFLSELAFGQFQKIVNQSFDLDDVTRLEVNLNGNVTYQDWEGMFVLIETKIEIENCNDNIFKSFVAAGRYLINTKVEGSTVIINSHKSLGQIVKSKLGETIETVSFKIYHPKTFKVHGDVLMQSAADEAQLSGGK